MNALLRVQNPGPGAGQENGPMTIFGFYLK